MARILSGPYGRPLGKAGGLVWGAARTVWGKVATIREYVIPTDPNTIDQQHQREVFRQAVKVLSTWTAVVYDYGWDRGVGELPGWQSMLSWILSQLHWDTGVQWRDPPSGISLGPCWTPTDIVREGGVGEGTVKVSYSPACSGEHCAPDDGVRVAVCREISPGNNLTEVKYDDSQNRGSGATGITISGLTGNTEYMLLVWCRHDEGDGTYTHSSVSIGTVTATSV